MKAFIVYPTYETIDGETVIQLFGRLENGQSFVTLNKFEPYFYIRKKDESILPATPKPIKVETTNLTNFKKEKVIKISYKTKTDLDNAFDKIKKEIETYEADIRPHYKYIIDNNLLSSIDIEGDYDSSEKIDRVYKEPKISSSSSKPDLKVLSIDTESDKEGNLYCIGLYAKNYQKNFLVSKNSFDISHTVLCETEEECLEKFKQELIKIDPDIITGWNVIDFDFAFLKELFKKHKISL